MPLTTVPIQDSFAGLVADRLVRNGLPPHGQFARTVGTALNHLVARHGAIIPGMEVMPAQARNIAAAGSGAALWRTRYRAGPNGTTLQCQVHLIPSDTVTSTPPAWYLKIDGVAQTVVTHDNYVPSGGGLDLNDVFVMTQDVAVTAGALHTVELWTQDYCRIVGWYLREKPRESLTIGTDELVNYTTLMPLSGIYDAPVQDLISDVALAVFQKLRGVHLSWNVLDPASPFIPANTTPTNIWDGSTLRTANTVGADCPTEYRETYMEAIAGFSGIPTYCWCYAQKDTGTDIKVRFSGAMGSSDITVNGAAGIYSTTGFTLVPASGGDKVDVQAFQNTASTGKIYAVGMFPLIGS